MVLTETSNTLDLSDMFPNSISTLSYIRTPDEQWVTIWSKWKITDRMETCDNCRTVCAKVQSPFGDIIIYGTIIPYHMAGVTGKRYGNLNYKIWEFHEKDWDIQSIDWNKLMTIKLPVFVIGDFNERRYDENGYGTNKVRNFLTDILKEININCITEMNFSNIFLTKHPKNGKVRKNIDHICLSNSLIDKFDKYNVGAWNHFTIDGYNMSDHNGVYVEFSFNKEYDFEQKC